MTNYRDLKTWQKAHELTLSIYKLTSSFPREEQFGLTSQLRRGASSIGANLAEGCGRSGDAELKRFCSIALGSTNEVEYHLLLARDLKLIKPKDYEDLTQRAQEIQRMLSGFMQKLSAKRVPIS